jgi:UDP-N-acetylmuramate dehydrogenase
MIRFLENYNLQAYNTFGVEVKTKYFFEFTELEDLDPFLQLNETWKEEKILLLGEGSNILFLNDFEGLVVHPNIPGVQIINEDRQYVWLEVGSGENWDEFVRYCVDCQFGGIENLAFIPGNVGAAPVQNIGAYGQEVQNVVDCVKGYDLDKREFVEYSNTACEFSYRNSIFKSKFKNRFIITSVVFKLDKFPEFNLGYQKLEKRVIEQGEVNLQNIKQAVIDIRSEKLPDVNVIGSAGSFFKNPIVDIETAKKIEGEHKEMPVFPAGEGKVKLAAGWLIEQCGWKGYREGDLGVHEKQALVIVNYGKASGADIYNLSEKIQESVIEKFGVKLDREVNCV